MERIERLITFLAANPSDSFLKHALALEWIKAGEDDKALSIFEEILTEDPLYVGSYYHLAKLLERKGEANAAKEWYEKGMAAATTAGDRHALSELRAAYDDLNEEM